MAYSHPSTWEKCPAGGWWADQQRELRGPAIERKLVDYEISCWYPAIEDWASIEYHLSRLYEKELRDGYFREHWYTGAMQQEMAQSYGQLFHLPLWTKWEAELASIELDESHPFNKDCWLVNFQRYNLGLADLQRLYTLLLL
jgi:hypothetical protein